MNVKQQRRRRIDGIVRQLYDGQELSADNAVWIRSIHPRELHVSRGRILIEDYVRLTEKAERSLFRGDKSDHDIADILFTISKYVANELIDECGVGCAAEVMGNLAEYFEAAVTIHNEGVCIY